MGLAELGQANLLQLLLLSQTFMLLLHLFKLQTPGTAL
jgi:hypothetical protein